MLVVLVLYVAVSVDAVDRLCCFDATDDGGDDFNAAPDNDSLFIICFDRCFLDFSVLIDGDDRGVFVLVEFKRNDDC